MAALLQLVLLLLALLSGAGAARAPLRSPAAGARRVADRFATWATELAAHGRRPANVTFIAAGAALRAARATAVRAALASGRLAELLELGRALSGETRAALEFAGLAPLDSWVNAEANLTTRIGRPHVLTRGAQAVVSHAVQLPGRGGAWLELRAVGRRPSAAPRHRTRAQYDVLTGADVPVQGVLVDGVLVLDAASAADCEEALLPNGTVRCIVGGIETHAPSAADAGARAMTRIRGGLSRLGGRAPPPPLQPGARALRELDAATYSVGARTVLMVSVSFTDTSSGSAPVPADLSSMCALARGNLTRAALGVATFSCVTVSSVVAVGLNSRASVSATEAAVRSILSQAGNALVSAPSTHLVLALPHSSRLDWAGLANTPGFTQWLNCRAYEADDLFCTTTLVHELGHNLGLLHAGGFTVGTAEWAEYGDPFDSMGSSEGPPAFYPLDFNSGFKHQMTWVPSSAVLELSPMDTPGALPASALQYSYRTDGGTRAVAFNLASMDTGSGSLPRGSVLAARLPAPVSGEWLYISHRALRPEVAGRLALIETPIDNVYGSVGASSVVDCAPFSATFADALVQPSGAFVYSTEDGPLLLENEGAVSLSAAGAVGVLVRASYLTSDARRPEGEGCLSSGACQSVWNAASVPALPCNSQATVALDPVTARLGVWAIPPAWGGTTITLSTCGSGTRAQLGVFTAPPAVERHTRAPLASTAIIAGTMAFNSATGARDTCETATLVVPSPLPAPWYVAVAGANRGAAASVTLAATCSSGSGAAPADRSSFVMLAPGWWGSGLQWTAHTSLVNGRVQWRSSELWIQYNFDFSQWFIVDSESDPDETSVYAHSASAPAADFTSIRSLQFYAGGSSYVSRALTFVFGCPPAAYFSAATGACLPCPAGAFAVPGASSPSQCVCGAGHTMAGASSHCEPCPVGTYKLSAGNTSTVGGCEACPAGTSSEPGSAVCMVPTPTPPAASCNKNWLPAPTGACACPIGFVLFPDGSCNPPVALSVTSAAGDPFSTDPSSGAFTVVVPAAAAAAVDAWQRAGPGGTPQFLWYDASRSEWSLSAHSPSSASPRFAFLPLGDVNVERAATALGFSVADATAASPFVDPVLASRGSPPAWALRSGRGALPAGLQPWRVFSLLGGIALIPITRNVSFLVTSVSEVPSGSRTASSSASPTTSPSSTATRSTSGSRTGTPSSTASPSSSRSAASTASVTASSSGTAVTSTPRATASVLPTLDPPAPGVWGVTFTVTLAGMAPALARELATTTSSSALASSAADALTAAFVPRGTGFSVRAAGRLRLLLVGGGFARLLVEPPGGGGRSRHPPLQQELPPPIVPLLATIEPATLLTMTQRVSCAKGANTSAFAHGRELQGCGWSDSECDRVCCDCNGCSRVWDCYTSGSTCRCGTSGSRCGGSGCGACYAECRDCPPPSSTPTPRPTSSRTPTGSITPSGTPTASITPSSSATASITSSDTPSASVTSSGSATASMTPSGTTSATATGTSPPVDGVSFSVSLLVASASVGTGTASLTRNGTRAAAAWGSLAALQADLQSPAVRRDMAAALMATGLFQAAQAASVVGAAVSATPQALSITISNVGVVNETTVEVSAAPPCLIPVAAICAFTATIPALYVYLILAAIGLVVLLVITLVAYCCCCRRRGRKAPASGGAGGAAVARSCAACSEAFKPQQHFHACAPCGYDMCTRCHADIPPAARQRMHAHALAFYVIDASGHALPAAAVPVAAVVAQPGDGTFTGVNPRFGPAGVAV